MMIKDVVNNDVLFELHLKFWNTASIGIPVRSRLYGRYSNKPSLVELEVCLPSSRIQIQA